MLNMGGELLPFLCRNVRVYPLTQLPVVDRRAPDNTVYQVSTRTSVLLGLVADVVMV
jgi:hypothetical protein